MSENNSPPPDTAPDQPAKKKRGRPATRHPSHGPSAYGASQWGPGWGGSSQRQREAVAAAEKADLPPPFQIVPYGGPYAEAMKKVKTAAAAAKLHVVDAVAVQVTIMHDPKAPAMARLHATGQIIERAEGKAVQPVLTNDDARTPEEREASIMALLRQLADAGAPVTIEGNTIKDAILIGPENDESR